MGNQQSMPDLSVSSGAPTKELFVTSMNKFFDGEKLCSLLRETGSCISGSLPMQVITGDEYADSDIDIFTTVQAQETFKKFLKDNGCVYEATAHQCLSPNGFYTSGISHVNNYRDNKSGTCIQLIVLAQSGMAKYGTTSNYVKEAFDFDFCKIVFDGENVIRYDNGTLDEKKCAISLQEIIKVKNDNGLKDNDKNVQDLLKRVEKYVSRGFTVTISP